MALEIFLKSNCNFCTEPFKTVFWAIGSETHEPYDKPDFGQQLFWSIVNYGKGFKRDACKRHWSYFEQ